MCGISIGWILLSVIVLYVALKLLRRKSKEMGVQKGRTEIDRWIDESLTRELHKKLGIDTQLVESALAGNPEPEAVGVIEEKVRSVQVKYEKTPDNSIEVRLEVSFEDGTLATAAQRLASDAVPAEIREEFSRTGAAFVFRPVHFPWSNTNWDN